MTIKLHALIHAYNAIETIIDTLKSLIGKVDDVFILDGRWIGVEYEGLHSTDGTIQAVTEFAKKHRTELPIFYILASKEMHITDSRNYLFDFIPEGDWFLYVDSDELVTKWMDDIRDVLSKTEAVRFRVTSGRNPRLPYSIGRVMKKTKGFRSEEFDHRYVVDDEHGSIPVGDLEVLPIQIVEHPIRLAGKRHMQPVFDKYRTYRHNWEVKQQSQT